LKLEVLSEKQKPILTELIKFPEFVFGGGTALALQLGHRKSVDFDLFAFKQFDNQQLIKKLDGKTIDQVIVDQLDQLTFLYKGVKITFLYYPFVVRDFIESEWISLIDKLSIGAMKAYALGRRAKWKDYVDIYFILKEYPLEKIIIKSKEIFGNLFNEKLFREQLGYFTDIDYSEKIDYIVTNPPTDKEIKDTLIKTASL
jgi:hypothetical protein